MIKHLTLIILFIINYNLQAQTIIKSAIGIDKPTIEKTINKIDLLDTVIFDLKRAVRIDPNFIDIPITIKADDDINALDFSLRFNQTHLKYHSIINHTGFISTSEYFNTTDATLRFTSNSLTRYDKDTIKLFSIRFEIYSDKLALDDFSAIMTYLNGEPCSFKLSDPNQSTATSNENISLIRVYPNPINEIVHFEVPFHCNFELHDLFGQKIFKGESLLPNQINTVDLINIKSGIYMITVFNEQFYSSKKIVIK